MPFRYTVGIIIFISVVVFMIYAGEAVKMFVIAAFAAYLISPAVVFLMDRTRLSRTAAVNIVYFTALIVLVGIPAALTPIFFDEIKLVGEDILDLTATLSRFLSEPIQLGGFVLHLEQLGESLAHFQEDALSPLPSEALELLEATSINILWLLIILVSVHSIMSEWPRMRAWLIQLAPAEYQDDMQELYARLRNVWMAYLRGQIVLMVVVGVVFTIAWAAIGIPGALVLGVLAGFFTLIPDVGPTVAAGLAIGVALLEGSTWIRLSDDPVINNLLVGLIAFVLYVILINAKNFFVRPIIIGRSLHMNEALIFVAILTATILWGILGALLMVPVMASVAVVFEYLRRRVLGLPPFGDDGGEQFKAPPEKTQADVEAHPNDEEKIDQ
jgi:predicted PurR-regulated permease PerM